VIYESKEEEISQKFKLKNLQMMIFLVDHLVKTPFFLPQRLSKRKLVLSLLFPSKKLLTIYVSIYVSVRGFFLCEREFD